jgi:hypothetical protein
MTNNSNAWPDDETLLAFADGLLPEEEALRVARHLETDVAARRTVAMYRRTGELAAQAFDDALHVRTSPALVDMLLNSTSPRAAGGRVVPLRHVLDDARRVAIPLAASMALVVAGALAWSLRDRSPSSATHEIALGEIGAGSPLADLLETKTAGSSLTTGRQEITVIVTFRDRLQRPCREFEAVPHGGKDLTMAIACRNDRGRWAVEGAAHVAEPADGQSSGSFSPAGGNATPALDGILKVLGATPAVTPDEEAALLASGWKK